MIKTIKEFSNFDVFAIVKELNSILLYGLILNVYEIEDLLILKINTNSGKKILIIKKDSRINLTEYNYPIPEYPTQYIRTLRKLLKNRRILGISQYKFDRIVIIELSNTDNTPWKFIIELFNKGNFLLLDENDTILIAKKYKKFKDRNILAKKEYIFPQSRGKDFLNVNKEEFIDLLRCSENEIVREISRNINLSGLYSEEICYIANVNKKALGKDLNDENYNNLYDSLKKLRNKLLFEKSNAQIILNKQNNEISVVPFEMEIFKEYEKRIFTSFNEAVDNFYSKIDYESITSPKDQKIEDQIKTQEKILINQQDYLEELKKKKKKYYELGDFIYANLISLEKLVSVILNAKQKGYNWEEINEKLLTAKKEEINGTEFFEKIIPSTNQLLVKINDHLIYLDLTKSIGENANLIYTKGKKAEKKIRGTNSAIKKTKEKIEKLNLEKASIEPKIDFLIKIPKKKWYEKFRCFISSEGFLIIGGRDATSNEVIFKKYLDPLDLVFHTNFPGSPLTVVKNPEKKNIPLKTIQEAADFVASYSRAWKENWGVVDVFYVQPDQISKTPPSGEFLQKGSFIISGKKNFVHNAKTELALGLKFLESDQNIKDDDKVFYPKIICGPESAIRMQTNNVIIIIPSKSSGFTKGKLAKMIKFKYIKSVDNDLRKWVNLLSINEIILYLPSGFSRFKSKT